ncbi:YeeE/YedE family protein [Endozoicomonas elysicola]|uniref:Transporter n=1 Tax=Endozoicomonas elysicola TaxID=305900 RepID=A0A081K787_9GAMM|nr:YeeE/YedE family protein [Endozoicomonas elysicola]KEI70013.1 transporter [Endozoicomonas elysicola]
MFYVIALLAGVLFGIGMALSGMVNPELVTAFLDISGQWDPTLIFVMGGALAVFIPGYQFLIKKRAQPILTNDWSLSKNNSIDVQLIVGTSLFGIGWGLLGVCPGPAVTSMLSGNSDVWLFIVAMMAGLIISHQLKTKVL